MSASLGTQGRRWIEQSSKLIRGTLDVLILKALIWGPLHGYAITSLIRRQSDEALLVEEGTLYPALWRLETKNLLEAEWGLSENNRKAKFYRLTPAGRSQLREECKTWDAYATAVGKVLNATHATAAGGELMTKIPLWRRCAASLARTPQPTLMTNFRFRSKRRQKT